MKEILILSCFFIVSNAYSNTKIHTFPTSTKIDRSKMLTETVSISFEPKNNTVVYDKSKNTYADTELKLKIVSTLSSYDPKLVISNYQLFLIDNISSCYSKVSATPDSSLDGYSNLVSIFLDDRDEKLIANEYIKVSGDSFSTNNSTRNHKITMKFDELDDDVKYCNGVVVMGFRYDL